MVRSCAKAMADQSRATPMAAIFLTDRPHVRRFAFQTTLARVAAETPTGPRHHLLTRRERPRDHAAAPCGLGRDVVCFDSLARGGVCGCSAIGPTYIDTGVTPGAVFHIADESAMASSRVSLGQSQCFRD